MKEAKVEFKYVRDCPMWASGECLHMDHADECKKDELSLPPEDCPWPEETIITITPVEECNEQNKN